MSSRLRAAFLGCLLAATAAADTHTSAPWVRPEGDLPQAALLAVGLVSLDPGVVAEHAFEEQIALRQAEARYLPILLRMVLRETNNWGPVRMLPAADPFAELLISGEILDSAGGRLSVRIDAIDSSGRRWLQRTYSTTIRISDFEKDPGLDPFEPLFQQVAADLAAFRQTLPLAELQRIIEISRLRYAARLAPNAFGDYLHSQPDGMLRINRLPAEDDPLLARVQRVREAEYLFVDAVDLYFEQYFRDLRPTHTAWRKSNLEAQSLMEAYRGQAASRQYGRRGQSAFKRYQDLQEIKLYQQTLRETLASFTFEVGPTTLDLDGELVQLSGNLSEQHDQWKSLLTRIYAAQVGLPMQSEPTD